MSVELYEPQCNGQYRGPEMKNPGARGLAPGEVLDGPGATLARVDRASVACSSLYQIDHFQNRPQKNSKPATAPGTSQYPSGERPF
jgi:hypothetical protein